jgi:hypothetical protein
VQSAAAGELPFNTRVINFGDGEQAQGRSSGTARSVMGDPGAFDLLVKRMIVHSNTRRSAQAWRLPYTHTWWRRLQYQDS